MKFIKNTVFLIFVFIYQGILKPLFVVFGIRPAGQARTCQHNPTCSRLFSETLKKDGLFQAIKKTTPQILTCHPFHKPKFSDNSKKS